jgi:uncharacterized protein YkwD
MVQAKKTFIIIFLCFLLTFFSSGTLVCFPQEELPSSREALYSLEKTLFKLVNQERQKRGLHAVRFSPDLSRLARRHSQDMAAREELTHSSSDGKSYKERLIEAGFHFIAIAENVAYSNGYQPELIHKGLMDSPGHRENILTPGFDEVGIAAVFKEGNGYYVTQDFRRAPLGKSEGEVQKDIQYGMNRLRRENNFPPLIFLPEADEYAYRCSLNSEKGNPPPPLPRRFGSTRYHFITSPSLEGIESIYAKLILDRKYEKAGLGVSYNRNEKFPGGTYFITILLFPESEYKNMSSEEVQKITFSKVNEVRERRGLPLFTWDKKLAVFAEKTAKIIFTQKTLSPAVLPRLGAVKYLNFITEDPALLPEGAEKQIVNDMARYERAGVGLYFGKNEEFERGAFWVCIIFGW